MTISKGASYTLSINRYPWSDSFAQSYSLIGATLLTEQQAKNLLDGQTIQITDPDPNQSIFYRGDLNVTGKWIKGVLTTGSLTGSTVAVLDIWITSGSCCCDINTLMASGCKCGGN